MRGQHDHIRRCINHSSSRDRNRHIDDNFGQRLRFQRLSPPSPTHTDCSCIRSRSRASASIKSQCPLGWASRATMTSRGPSRGRTHVAPWLIDRFLKRQPIDPIVDRLRQSASRRIVLGHIAPDGVRHADNPRCPRQVTRSAAE